MDTDHPATGTGRDPRNNRRGWRALLWFVLGAGAAVGVQRGLSHYLEWIRASKPNQHMIAIAELEDQWHAAHGAWLSCGPVPHEIPTSSDGAPWPGDPCFDRLGFHPEGTVYASYAVVASSGGFVVLAWVRGEEGGPPVVIAAPMGQRQRALTPR